MQKYIRAANNICRSFTSFPKFFRISEEVSESFLSGKPVIAMESTLITHGLPYPENIKTVNEMEKIVRSSNATPATIGIIGGKVIIGMNSTEISSIASKSGVHRGAETSMDISADLHELSRTPIAVVSAGVKSILDIGRTLEYLETLGVCVATFGPTKDFPAFFTPKSNFQAPCNVESAKEAANLIETNAQLGLENGVLIAVPIPEEYREQGLKTEAVIEDALKEAREKNVVGRDVTPFVLSRVQELSKGAALEANIGLLLNNTRVGTRIAIELNKLRSPEGTSSSRVMRSPVTHEAKNVFSSGGRPIVKL
ncbi:pseudouridine-5'-phosphate glycosidase [Caerostris extrusa]|uniref:Pseudouridine-5'-phosphate glycosidase n=1 Tax=Caerostris extrusa TaxID=172846 RepID=A0AAV4WSC5_CAEEX|nr:pseudouridine-5'-phosphate glycosidase [Caerostris extrusa]